MIKEIIVDRLSKIFPNTVIYHEGEFARDSNESDPDYTFIPPHELDWKEFIKILNENGLDITDKTN